MGIFSKKSHFPTSPELDELGQQESALQDKIDNLERFLTDLPSKAKEEMEERCNVMPPPEELEDIRRERKFNARLSRNQLRNERRYQAQNGSIVIMLIICTVAILAWAWKIAQSGF